MPSGMKPSRRYWNRSDCGSRLDSLRLPSPVTNGRCPKAGVYFRHPDVGQRRVQRDLPRGGRQQILTAQHVGDLHQRVVHRVDQRVQRIPGGPHQHRVRHAAGRKGDRAADQVDPGDVAVRHPQPQHRAATRPPAPRRSARRPARGRSCRSRVSGPGRPPRAAPRCRRRWNSDSYRWPAASRSRGDLGVDVPPLALPVRSVRTADQRAFVPVQTQPLQRVDDRLVGLLGIPGRVGVLDPEDQAAAVVTGERPVEQCGAGQPDMRGAGRVTGRSAPERTGTCRAGWRDLGHGPTSLSGGRLLSGRRPGWPACRCPRSRWTPSGPR